MKSIVAFLSKEETTGEDLTIILIGCVAFASAVIMYLLVTGQ